MVKAEVREQAASAAPARFAGYAWMALAYNVTVILWGAYVRATGSGAGCGNRWPLCNGVESQSPATATIIEFTHRAMTALDVAVIAWLVIWAFRAFPKRSPVRFAAALSAVFLVTEALLGAALVLLNHVANNASANRAYSLSAHLINTMTLLACLTMTAWLAGGKPAPRLRGREAWLAGITLVAFLALGVSGAIAALGDTLFPAHSLSEGFAQDFNPAASIFVRLRLWHPVLAAVVGLWMGFYGVFCVWRRRDVQLASGILMAMVGLQLAAGLMNLALLAPLWSQLLHLLLADLLWISLVVLCAEMLAPPPRRI